MNRILFLALGVAFALVAVLVAFLGRRRRVLAGGGLIVALVASMPLVYQGLVHLGALRETYLRFYHPWWLVLVAAAGLFVGVRLSALPRRMGATRRALVTALSAIAVLASRSWCRQASFERAAGRRARNAQRRSRRHRGVCFRGGHRGSASSKERRSPSAAGPDGYSRDVPLEAVGARSEPYLTRAASVHLTNSTPPAPVLQTTPKLMDPVHPPMACSLVPTPGRALHSWTCAIESPVMSSSLRVQHILTLASELSETERDELLDAFATVLDVDDEGQRAEVRSRADRVLRGESNGRALSDAELAGVFGLAASQ